MGQANAILGKFGAKYDGTVMVRHLLWLLIDDIGLDELTKMVVNPLNGLKVAPFYGCHIIRPGVGQRLGIGAQSAFARRSHRGARRRSRRLRRARRAAAASTCSSKKTASRRTWSARTCAWPRTPAPKPCSRRARSATSRSTAIRRTRAARWGRTDLPTFHLPQLVALALGIDPSKLGHEQAHHLARRGAASRTISRPCTSPSTRRREDRTGAFGRPFVYVQRYFARCSVTSSAVAHAGFRSMANDDAPSTTLSTAIASIAAARARASAATRRTRFIARAFAALDQPARPLRRSSDAGALRK